MRVPILVAALAFFAVPCFAQQVSMDNQSTVTQMPNWPAADSFPSPTAPLRAALAPNPKFPLRVGLKLSEHHFNYLWSDFRGQGKLVVNNDSYNFRYECPDTFRTRREFQARWSKDGKKLDILLQKPDSSHTEVCTLNIVDHS
jgi:hypothetical protein